MALRLMRLPPTGGRICCRAFTSSRHASSSTSAPPPKEQLSYEEPETTVFEELMANAPLLELEEDILATTASTPFSEPPVGPNEAYGPPNPALVNPLRDAKVVDGKQALNHPLMYGLHVKATRNNTIATFTRPDGGPVARFTGGKCGFKGQRRNSFEAGYQCAVRSFRAIEEEKAQGRNLMVKLFLSGFGQGRDATIKALMASEGQEVRKLVTRITDTTPIKIGGTRSKKMRR